MTRLDSVGPNVDAPQIGQRQINSRGKYILPAYLFESYKKFLYRRNSGSVVQLSTKV